MDYIRVLEQAQKGNYDSYETLLSSLSQNPDQVLAMFEYFCNSQNLKDSRDLIGLFLKNWLQKDSGKLWWSVFQHKADLVQKILLVEDSPSVTSLILASLISIEDNQQSSQILNLFLSYSTKASITALSYYLESSRTVLQVIVNYVTQILPGLVESDPVLGLQVFQRTVKHLVPGALVESLARKIFSMVSNTSDSNLIVELYRSVVDLVSHFYEAVQPYCNILNRMVCEGIFFNDDQVNHLAYECINVLVDVEQHRKHDGGTLFNLVELYSEEILSYLIRKIEQVEDEEEVLTISSTFQGICEIIHRKVELLLPVLGEKLKSQVVQTQVSGVYLIGSVLPSLSPEKICSIKEEILATIQIALGSANPRMKNASIWLMLKIAENCPEIIQNNPGIFEVLYQSLENPHKTVIDCLLEIADGDIKVPYPEKFIEKLMYLGLNTKHVNSFNVVRSLVQSMPSESGSLIPLIHSLIPLISSNHKSQSSLSIILRACLEKLSESSVTQFYPVLMSLLSSLPLNDEYLVACSCLSRHSEFQNYINCFTSALASAISIKESYSSGIICVSELVRNLEFSDWLPPLMPSILKLLNKTSTPNTQLLEALTDIVSLHTTTCFPHMQEIIDYADYCMTFSLSDYEDTEFVDELKELIVSFYEGVIQGLENVGKVEIIAGKVSDIVKFCLLVTQDSENQNLLAGALGIFADIAMAFGNLPERENILKFVKQFVNNESEMVRMNAECAVKTISELG